MVNRPTDIVAAMVADLTETKRIHNEGKYNENQGKTDYSADHKMSAGGSIMVSCKLMAISDIIRDPKGKFK